MQLLNLFGGGFAAASAYITNNAGALPLAVLETIWAAIALAGLVQIAWARWSAGASPRAAAAAAAAVGRGAAAAPRGDGEEGAPASGAREDKEARGGERDARAA